MLGFEPARVALDASARGPAENHTETQSSHRHPSLCPLPLVPRCASKPSLVHHLTFQLLSHGARQLPVVVSALLSRSVSCKVPRARIAAQLCSHNAMICVTPALPLAVACHACCRLKFSSAHARKVVLRTPKGIVVMAPCLRVGTECSGMELVPYALDRIGLRGQFQMAFVCENYGPCRSLIRQCHRKATKPRTVFKDCEEKICGPSRPRRVHCWISLPTIFCYGCTTRSA